MDSQSRPMRATLDTLLHQIAGNDRVSTSLRRFYWRRHRQRIALVARHEAQSCAPCYPDWDSNGAFVIGAGLAWFNRLTGIDPMWKLLITTGFCGGLTTFSTFSAEVVFLLQQGRVSWALLNVAVNLLGSFAMTAVAFWLFSQAASR